MEPGVLSRLAHSQRQPVLYHPARKLCPVETHGVHQRPGAVVGPGVLGQRCVDEPSAAHQATAPA